MLQSRRYTLKLPHEWAEIYSDPTIIEKSTPVPGSKQAQQSVWVYARPEDEDAYQEVVSELKGTFRRRRSSSEDKSASEKDLQEKDKHVTYGAVELMQ